MSPLMAFALGCLTACTLMRIALSIIHHIEEHHDHHDHDHRKDHS